MTHTFPTTDVPSFPEWLANAPLEDLTQWRAAPSWPATLPQVLWGRDDDALSVALARGVPADMANAEFYGLEETALSGVLRCWPDPKRDDYEALKAQSWKDLNALLQHGAQVSSDHWEKAISRSENPAWEGVLEAFFEHGATLPSAMPRRGSMEAWALECDAGRADRGQAEAFPILAAHGPVDPLAHALHRERHDPTGNDVAQAVVDLIEKADPGDCLDAYSLLVHRATRDDSFSDRPGYPNPPHEAEALALLEAIPNDYLKEHALSAAPEQLPPLWDTCALGWAQCMNRWFESGVDPNRPFRKGMVSIHMAGQVNIAHEEHGRADAVLVFMKQGGKPKVLNDPEVTARFQAVQKNDQFKRSWNRPMANPAAQGMKNAPPIAPQPSTPDVGRPRF